MFTRINSKYYIIGMKLPNFDGLPISLIFLRTLYKYCLQGPYFSEQLINFGTRNVKITSTYIEWDYDINKELVKKWVL